MEILRECLLGRKSENTAFERLPVPYGSDQMSSAQGIRHIRRKPGGILRRNNMGTVSREIK